MEEEAEETKSEKKTKPGKPTSAEVLEKRDEFYKNRMDDIVVDGQILPLKSAVFTELANECKTTVKAEYLAAKRYAKRNDLLKNRHSSDDNGDDDYTPFEGIEHHGEKYTIDISEMDLFYDRKHSKPKPISEFNDALIKVIFEKSRKPCAWSFGRIFTQDGEVKLHALCLNKKCNATLVLYTENEQARLQLLIFNYDSTVSHVKKRYLTDVSEKEKVEALLELECAMVTRAKLANDYLFENNEYAAHLCSKAALKQRKHRMHTKSHRHDIATVSIQIMKSEPEYMHVIQDIGLDPFFVFFALPLQKEFLLESTRRKNVDIAIDATGIGTKSPEYSSVYCSARGEKYKKCFLYLICLVIEKKHVPVFQVISQRHSHDFIAYMLHYFKERILNGKFPSEVIMDDSAALLLANILTFTQAKSMLDYLNQCYDALFDHAEPPKCYVRLDPPHFINSLNHCKALNAVDKTKKKFYKRILGYVMLCDDITEVKVIIENVFILLKNEYIYTERVVQAKDDLEQLVKSHKSVITDNTYDDYTGIQEIEMDQTLNTKIGSKFKEWVKGIESYVDDNFVNHALNDSSEETTASRNPYVSHQLTKTISKIFSKIALFSNVMNGVFKSKNMNPSTSGTEAQFHNMKAFVFQSKKGYRLDTWLERGIEVTKGIFKAMIADLKEKKKSEALSDEDHNDENTNIEEENWKNQNVDAKKTKDTGRTHRNIYSILNPESDEYSTVPVLPNGGKSKKHADIPELFSIQTCGPDAFFHLFAACYADCPQFKEMLDKDETHLAEFIRLFMSAEAKDQVEKVLAYRNRLLLDLFPETVIDIGKVKSIDCEERIAQVYSKICQICPLFYSVQVWAECCENYVEKEFIKFNLKNFDVRNIQQSIHLIKSRHRCDLCKKTSNVNQQPQFIIALDCENADHNIDLNDIQREIQIGRLPYILLGIVEHRTRNKHFVAHALRSIGSSGSLQWVEYDDLKCKPKKHEKFTAERVVAILYRLKVEREGNNRGEKINPAANPSGHNESHTPSNDKSLDESKQVQNDSVHTDGNESIPTKRIKIEKEEEMETKTTDDSTNTTGVEKRTLRSMKKS